MGSFSNRILSINQSATSAISVKVEALRTKGVEVISLGQGEPGFKTPQYICDAAKSAIDSGQYFSYPPTGGYQDLREAIAHKYTRENNVPYRAENIVVSNGAKQALSNVMFCLLNPGDEVIILAPFWVSYEAQVKLAGAKPVMVKGKAQNGFKVSIEQLRKVISKKTRAIVFSSPCNPTGLVYHRNELEELAGLVSSYPNLMVIADEIYEHINYTSDRTSFASIPGMFERTITINGFGKCYAMTGWRVGYLAAHEPIAKAVIKIQGHLSSSNSSIAQRAALSAITGGLEPVNEMVKMYRERRDLAYALLNEISGIRLALPEGAFYFFPDVSNYYGLWHERKQIKNSIDICDFLLNVAHVAVVPGVAFGEDNCVRISYAESKQTLVRAIQRIKMALNSLKAQERLRFLKK